ncbi:YrzI family small protein [Halobacillus amylolyticus]|uniref:YrzI family small protein n=1 Tax=Halobacillus amylolyticus TaxID=2932259 RepID=A0ABY4HF37_9BACI|nr:YrzI family small protein [Halobacillus amylolyticus]UOR13017.1 YrzI family small protein [Halobacillus amylolyticus]
MSIHFLIFRISITKRQKKRNCPNYPIYKPSAKEEFLDRKARMINHF